MSSCDSTVRRSFGRDTLPAHKRYHKDKPKPKPFSSREACIGDSKASWQFSIWESTICQISSLCLSVEYAVDSVRGWEFWVAVSRSWYAGQQLFACVAIGGKVVFADTRNWTK